MIVKKMIAFITKAPRLIGDLVVETKGDVAQIGGFTILAS